MNYSLRKCFGFLLALMLLVALLPTSAHAADEYDLWVGGVRVTSENLSGNCDGGGTWSYSGNATSGKLTLTDATITGKHGHSSSDKTVYGNIDAEGIDLTVVLVGKNTVGCSAADKTADQTADQTAGKTEEPTAEHAIIAWGGSLTFEGGGSLTAKSTEACVLAEKTLTVNSGSLDLASSASSGLNGANAVMINGGTVTAAGSGEKPGISTGDEGILTINSGIVTGRSVGGHGIRAKNIVINGGSVTGESTNQYGIVGGALTIGSALSITEPEGGTQGEIDGQKTVMDGESPAKKAVIAQFVSVTASVNPTDGGSVSGEGTYAVGATAELTAAPNEHYRFKNWTENGTQVSTDAKYTFIVTGERELTANFELKIFEISVSAEPSQGGTVTGGGTYNDGNEITVTATPNEGCGFLNWTENGTEVSTDAEYSFTVTDDRELVANFAMPRSITVSAEPAEGGTVEGGGTCLDGQTTTVKAAANEGYSFLNWTENGTEVSTDAEYSFTVTGDRELVANFVKIYSVTVSAEPAEGGTAAANPASGRTGDEILLSATANAGFTFKEWKVISGDVSVEDGKILLGTEDVVVQAVFEPIIYKVSFDPNGGTGDMDEAEVPYGQKLSLPECGFTAPTGKEFDKWDAGMPGDEIDVAGDMTVTAQWKWLTFTVTFESNGGSAVSEQIVEYGQTAEEPDPEPTKKDASFDGWYSDKECTEVFDFGTPITRDTTLYAKWDTGVKYTITAVSNNAVVTKGKMASLVITVKRSPDDDKCLQHFKSVKVDGKELVKDTDYTVKAGSTVVTFKSATLNTFTSGAHTITIVFDDGDAVARVVFKAGIGGGGGAGGATPKMGDNDNLGLWIGLFAAVAGLAVLAAILLTNLRRRKGEAAPAEEFPAESAEEPREAPAPDEPEKKE